MDLLQTLSSLFALLYKSCDKGRDKYTKFQLEWHQNCSVFLMPPGKTLCDAGIDPQKNMDLAHLQQRWIGYCEGKSANKDVRDAIMISICSAVYNYQLKRVSKVQQIILDDTSSTAPMPQEIDSVYYRFCGAAIASMLHSRYDKRRTCKEDRKATLNQEIQVLKAIQCTDKSHIPQELKYRDRGFMYFPSDDLLPFLRALDGCIMENANASAFKKYGSEMIDVAVKQLESTQELKQTFSSVVTKRLQQGTADLDVSEFYPSIHLVYKELSHKLCHTRLGEFISVTEQQLAASKGKSTLAGQNLRDELLTSHLKTKSMIN